MNRQINDLITLVDAPADLSGRGHKNISTIVDIRQTDKELQSVTLLLQMTQNHIFLKMQ